ncbi:hypothetical protein ACIRP7_13805 [Streptomyces sp. NPDC102270]|uniref:hypothetical protein n=1 Tax=Streptomyces sp. NPDC102270 TaxID=3366150 RepID=UPI0037F1A61C
MTTDVHAPPVEPLTGGDAIDLLDRMHVMRFQRLAHRSRTLVRIDWTLPEHCPARVTRHGTRRMVLIAPDLTPAERVEFLATVLGTRQ